MVNLITQTSGAYKNVHGHVNEQFLLRIAGLPINSVDQLQFKQLTSWVQQVTALEDWLNEHKATVSDHLHQLVNDYKEDQKVRRALINLKRSIFNMRVSSVSDAYTTAQRLSEEQRAPLVEWLKVWEHYQEQLQAGNAIYAAEVQEKRALLKNAINLSDFRKGIFLASPLLDQFVDNYLQSDNAKLSRNERTLERSLLEYLLRTACKTSPFSTLTSVSIGQIQKDIPEGEQVVIGKFDDLNKVSFTRLNLAVLSRIIQSLLEADAIKNSLEVRLTSGWRLQGNRVRYLRRRTNIDEPDPDAPLALSVLHEDVLTLPAGPLLRSLINFMQDKGLVPLDEVKKYLISLTGLKETHAEIEAFLARLLRLHFLIVPMLQLDIHSQDPVRTFIEGLHEINIPAATFVAEQIEQVNERVHQYAPASLEQRHKLLEEIAAQVQKGHELLIGTTVPLPRTLVYEDTVIRPRSVAIAQKQWDEVFTQLMELQSLLPIFDFNTSRKLITKGYFRARYGAGMRCDDFLAFADTFNLDFFEQHQKDAMGKETLDDQGKFTRRQNTFKLPEITRLDDARQAVADYITQEYARLDLDETVLKLGQAFLDHIAPYVPAHLQQMQSHAFFLQVLREGQKPQAIINRIYTGMTLMFSRFAHCFAEEDGHQVIPQLRRRFAELQPEGVVFAELKGGYDATNLNLHPTITPYELVCPGELSTRPQEEQIQLDDLYIQDDLVSDALRLYSRRLGKEVIPVYLGFLVPMMLPEIQQILLNFSHMSMCPLDLWNGVPEKEAGAEQVVTYPRLQYKDLILQRAQWQISIDLFPQRDPNQPDADFFLRLNRWRQRNGIPTKVFFKPVKAPRINDRNEIEDGYEGVSNSRKPLYVDFENYFSLQLLEATTKKMKGRVQLTEMLPQQDQLWLQHQGQSYVSELVLEVNSVNGGSYAND